MGRETSTGPIKRVSNQPVEKLSLPHYLLSKGSSFLEEVLPSMEIAFS
jgi:hypothetical protein